MLTPPPVVSAVAGVHLDCVQVCLYGCSAAGTILPFCSLTYIMKDCTFPLILCCVHEHRNLDNVVINNLILIRDLFASYLFTHD